MTKQEQHFNNCSAPICCCDPNPNYKSEVVWCPGEQVCRWQPYSKVQENQIIINELFRQGKFEDGTFSADHLERVKVKKRPSKKT